MDDGRAAAKECKEELEGRVHTGVDRIETHNMSKHLLSFFCFFLSTFKCVWHNISPGHNIKTCHCHHVGVVTTGEELLSCRRVS